MTPDLELITRIKESADSSATSELINRHSGVYIDVINEYAWSSKVKVKIPDLKDDRAYNIYNWAVNEFDPNKGVQFGSYVGKMTRWMCLNLINREGESVELNSPPNTDTDTRGAAETHIDIEEIKTEARNVGDPLFWRIFKLRFDAKRPRSWRAVGSKMKMSHEGARKCFLKHIGLVREHMAT